MTAHLQAFWFQFMDITLSLIIVVILNTGQKQQEKWTSMFKVARCYGRNGVSVEPLISLCEHCNFSYRASHDNTYSLLRLSPSSHTVW